MSNQVNKTILQDGTKTAVIHYTFASDGVEGELNSYVLLDPYTDLSGIDFKIQLVVTQIWFGFSWFDMNLSFEDGGSNLPFWTLTRDSDKYVDFRYFGGIKDRTNLVQPDTGSQFGERSSTSQRHIFPDQRIDLIRGQTTPTGRIIADTKGFADAGSTGSLILEVKKNLALSL